MCFVQRATSPCASAAVGKLLVEVGHEYMHVIRSALQQLRGYSGPIGSRRHELGFEHHVLRSSMIRASNMPGLPP